MEIPPTKEWALFVYMCADVPQPGMHRASRANLLQMANSGSSDDVWVVAQLACPGPWTYRYIFPQRPPGSEAAIVRPVRAIASVNSAIPGSIEDFFAWAAAACPAKKIFLVLWGHGYGIDYYTPQVLSNLQSLGELSTLEISTSAKNAPINGDLRTGALLAADPEHTFAFGWDASSNDILDNSQIGDALRLCTSRLPAGQQLAIMGFDACVMAMAEVWSEMRSTAEIGIASQAGLPYSSWPYGLFLERLLQKPAAQPADVAKMLSEAFLEFYGTHTTEYVTISACDLTRIGDLESSIGPLASALATASADPRARQNIFEARKCCPQYDEQGFIDLGCFCRFLQITMPNSTVSEACGPALQAIDNFVIGSNYSPPKPDKTIALSTGVSVWLPPWIQDPNAYAIEKSLAEAYLSNGYLQTQFALTTSWGKFLTTFREHAWDETSKGASRTGLRPTPPAAKRNAHNGGSTMGDERMGDEHMGDEHMGDERMGDEHMGDERMGAGGKNARRVFSTVSSGAAGVVLRATVESFGPAGDAELHLTVRWPASSLGAGEMGVVPPVRETQTKKPNERDGRQKFPSPNLAAPSKKPKGPARTGTPHSAAETPPGE
ncbi:MAG TPA: clostripain-related cysteine peptidase [Terriglobia bacterium]|nr:clostripain-related cysteine peptidase [Terriglobia bacterium]